MKNKALIFGGLALAAVAGFVWWKKKQAAESSGTATPDAASAAAASSLAGVPAPDAASGADAGTTAATTTATTTAAQTQNDAMENPSAPATPPPPATINGYLVSDIDAASEHDYALFQQKITARTGKPVTAQQDKKFQRQFLKQYAKTHVPGETA